MEINNDLSSAEQQPRVVILTATTQAAGGMERIAVNLTRVFTRRGCQTHCVFPRRSNSEDLLAWCRQQGVEAEATAAFLHTRLSHTLADTLHLSRALSAWHPTAVSLHYAFHISLKDVVAARLAGAKHCVATIHSLPMSWMTSRDHMMTRLASRLVDAVVVHSRQVGQALIEHGVPASKVAYVPPGLRLPESIPTKMAARSRLGLPAEAFIIGTHARLSSEKGVAELLDVVGQLPAHADGPYLLIAGDGPQREELISLGAEKLGPRVRLLGRVGEDFANFYAALDVFALAPYVKEAFGLVFIEAAQCGVPSVSWRTGGVAEAVIDGETGLLAEPEDLAGLKGAISRLREDPALRAQLGSAAQMRANAEFTEEHMGEEYARILRLPLNVPAHPEAGLMREFEWQRS